MGSWIIKIGGGRKQEYMNYREYLRTIHIPKLLRKSHITMPISDIFNYALFEDVEDERDFILLGRALFTDRAKILDEITRSMNYALMSECGLAMLKIVIDSTREDGGIKEPLTLSYEEFGYIIRDAHGVDITNVRCNESTEISLKAFGTNIPHNLLSVLFERNPYKIITNIEGPEHSAVLKELNFLFGTNLILVKGDMSGPIIECNREYRRKNSCIDLFTKSRGSE